jgi:hypothetical protein
MYEMKYDKAVYNKYYGYIYIRWAIICAISSVIVYVMIISANLFDFTYPKYFIPIGVIALFGPIGLLLSLSFYRGKRNQAELQVQDIREGVLFGDIPTRRGWDGVSFTVDDKGTTYTCANVRGIVWTRRYIIVHGDVWIKARDYVALGNRTGGGEKEFHAGQIKIPRTFANEGRLTTLVKAPGGGYHPDQNAWDTLLSRQEAVDVKRKRIIKRGLIIAPIVAIAFSLLFLLISMLYYR